MKPDGFIVWPPISSDDMTKEGPALCSVWIEPSGGCCPYCEIQCPDGSTICTYRSDVADTPEQAITDWLKHAQRHMQDLRQQVEKVLDLKPKL